MAKLFFIITFFISSNLYSATYLICSGYDEINIKLGNNEIFIKKNDSNEYENYTENITIWNDEIIETKILWEYHTNPRGQCNMSQMFSKCKESNSCLLNCSRLPTSQKLTGGESILIDRVSGTLKYSNSQKDLLRYYKCQIQKKTLF